MKTKMTLYLLGVFLTAVVARGQKVEWATHLYATGTSIGNAATADPDGNYYVTGFFGGSMTFGGSTNLSGSGLGDLYIAKYGPDRSLRWVRSGTSQGWNGGRGIAVDKESNVLVAGRIEGTTNFNGKSVTGVGENDVVLAKYSSSGDIQWVKSAGGSGMDWANGIAVDGKGNSYVAGFFSGTATFGTAQLTSAGNYDIFIASYTPDGEFRWARSAGGSGQDEGYGVAVDLAGDVYLTGIAVGTVNFGSVSFSGGTKGGFVAKYAEDGRLKWVKGSAGDNSVESISINEGGEIFVSGAFAGSLTLGGQTVTSAGAEDIYVARYDVLGNANGLWRMGGTGSDGTAGFGQAMEVVAAKDSGFFLVSSFENTLTLGTLTAQSAGKMDIFLARFGKGGDARWLVTAQGTDREHFVSLGVDSYNNCYMMGNYFSPTCTIGTTTLPRNSTIDMLVVKVKDESVPTIELPKVRVSNSRINFGDIRVGTSASNTITVTPGSGADLVVRKVYFDDPAAASKGYSLTAPTTGDLPALLSSSQELDITVKLNSQVEGDASTLIAIETNDPISPKTTINVSAFGVRGNGELPTAILSTTELNFGKVPLGYNSRKSFTISGANAAGLEVQKVAFKEPGSFDLGFDIIAPKKNDLPTYLDEGESLEVIVEFTAAEYDPAEFTLVIETNDGLQPQREVIVQGKGSNLPKAELNTFNLDFGNTMVGVPAEGTLRVTAGSDAGLTINAAAIDGAGATLYRIVSPDLSTLPIELEEGENIEMRLEFTPQDTGISTARILIETNDPFLSEAEVVLTGYGEPIPTSGVAEESRGGGGVTLLPNPMRLEGELSINLPLVGAINVQIIDLSGRVIMSVYEGEYRGGEVSIPCNVRGLETGTYFCMVEIGGKQFYRMLAVNK
ncbi:MAG: choice-of-anchor D domain-containing protein [Ignavibacteriae bacterium]|nr:choice-of-anchor D domain-containing protein [Ignavibacteriota bacterium]MCB9214422.1 choice-of-anchor D domain-containing protein [Ignavibacteria bacterium]